MKKLLFFLLILFVISCSSKEKQTPFTALSSEYPNQTVMAYLNDNTAVIGKLKEVPADGTFNIEYNAFLLLNKKSVEMPFDGIQNAKFDVKNPNIIYIVDKNSDLYKWDYVKNTKELLDESVMDTFDLSPDGTKLAYMKGEMPDYDLYIINLKTKVLEKLTETTSSAWNPVFSPDSKEIAFVYSPDGYPSIWKLSIETKNLTLLTNKEMTPQKAMECGECLDPFPANKDLIWKGDNLLFEKNNESFMLNLSSKSLKKLGKIKNLHKDIDGKIVGTDEDSNLQILAQ